MSRSIQGIRKETLFEPLVTEPALKRNDSQIHDIATRHAANKIGNTTGYVTSYITQLDFCVSVGLVKGMVKLQIKILFNLKVQRSQYQIFLKFIAFCFRL